MDFYYDSRNPAHKAPFGAVAAGVAVSFRVWLSGGVGRAALVIAREGDLAVEIELRRGEGDLWSCDFTPPVPGLYFYAFAVDADGGRHALRHGGRGLAVNDGAAPQFQLTVCAADFKTPAAPRGGILYQIFPDRFRRSGEAKAGVPADRILRDDWGGVPFYGAAGGDNPINRDFFGGDLRGITSKLSYLEGLGVTDLYLCPVFESHENHRYSTADYESIDPLLGTEDDLRELCREAASRGMRVILDGVFSHTGSDSRYFNAAGRYPDLGAAQSKSSPYYPWFQFTRYPDEYKSWWGVHTLPEIREEEPSYIDYICGEEGILRRWQRAGVSGWRLDVADELPDVFLDALRMSVKRENPEALVIGEVWEDATTKFSYGARRRYLLGAQLDSVMNYPLQDAIARYLLSGDAQILCDLLMHQAEHYPAQSLHTLMNMLSTHDVERIVTRLGDRGLRFAPRRDQAGARLPRGARARAVSLVKLAYALLYFAPGIPMIYYGDEIGAEGYRDPFCRGCFDWEGGDGELLAFMRELGRVRRGSVAFAEGSIFIADCHGPVLSVLRERGGERMLLCCNAGGAFEQSLLPDAMRGCEVLWGEVQGGRAVLPPHGIAIVRGRASPALGA